MKTLTHRMAVALTLLTITLAPISPTSAQENDHAPVKVIFDTDMSGDCDDCGALAILHILADRQEAEILAVVVNSADSSKSVAGTVSSINTYYGRPQIPIGVNHDKGSRQTTSSYTEDLKNHFPNNALSDDKMPSALLVYRQALSDAPDASVTIISVGFFCNLRELLQSQPDDISPLSGLDLIKTKVKRLVVMGGKFPLSADFSEYNFSWACTQDTQFVVDHWPTPILFSGFEIGSEIITGKALTTTPKTNPVRRAYELSFGNCLTSGRPSWDLTAVLAAVRDPNLYWEVSPNGVCAVYKNGTNRWEATDEGKQTYLIKKVPTTQVVQVLDELMTTPPRVESQK